MACWRRQRDCRSEGLKSLDAARELLAKYALALDTRYAEARAKLLSEVCAWAAANPFQGAT
jgi:hypothetical protein